MNNRPYDEEALWLKAKLFLNHAMDETEPRTFDERALWASLALELLAKAALSRASPLLIAHPNEDGKNLLIASGLVQGTGTFQSVTARTLFGRCAAAFAPFDERVAGKIAAARNDYLHGGTPAFTSIPEHAWWPSFWAQAVILVHAQDKDIGDLVGSDRSAVVEEHLARNRRNVEHRLQMLVSRAAQRLEQFRAGSLPERLATDFRRAAQRYAGLPYSTHATCPACASQGTIEGEAAESFDLQHEQVAEDEWESWVELTVVSEYFSCETCGLVLDSYELIAAAELPGEFPATGDPADFLEPEYGND